MPYEHTWVCRVGEDEETNKVEWGGHKYCTYGVLEAKSRKYFKEETEIS